MRSPPLMSRPWHRKNNREETLIVMAIASQISRPSTISGKTGKTDKANSHQANASATPPDSQIRIKTQITYKDRIISVETKPEMPSIRIAFHRLQPWVNTRGNPIAFRTDHSKIKSVLSIRMAYLVIRAQISRTPR